MQILYTYFDHKNRTFSNLLTLPNNLRFNSASVQHIHIFFWMNYHPDFVLDHDFEISMSLHLNPANNNYVFSVILQDSTSFLDRQIWCPTTWEFSNPNGLTFWALWYWRLSNATNRTNLHMFGMTLVSPIYSLEFLIYPFWAYLI